MCNFVPGECLAIAEESVDAILDRLSQWHFPGRYEVFPLLNDPTIPLSQREPFRRNVWIHITEIPEGLEVLAVSKLSAALQDLIGAHRAVVELNLYLPMAAQAASRQQDTLSQPARNLANQLRQYSILNSKTSPIRPIGLLDSGVAFSLLSPQRRVSGRDYTGPRQTLGYIVEDDHDVRGHGTEVCRILDAALLDQVSIVSGRVTKADINVITVLQVAGAFAHMAAAEDPAVINLSLAPRDDARVCSRCHEVVSIHAFHSLILPYVFRLASDRTLTVMAAGNRGQVSNARHALAETSSLALVEATSSTGRLASYSNQVDAKHAAVARAFGGDDDKTHGVAMFENIPHTVGTSYAAPFVSAAAYLYKLEYPDARFDKRPDWLDFGEFCSRRLRLEIDFQPFRPSEAK